MRVRLGNFKLAPERFRAWEAGLRDFGYGVGLSSFFVETAEPGPWIPCILYTKSTYHPLHCAICCFNRTSHWEENAAFGCGTRSDCREGACNKQVSKLDLVSNKADGYPTPESQSDASTRKVGVSRLPLCSDRDHAFPVPCFERLHSERQTDRKRARSAGRKSRRPSSRSSV